MTQEKLLKAEQQLNAFQLWTTAVNLATLTVGISVAVAAFLSFLPPLG